MHQICAVLVFVISISNYITYLCSCPSWQKCLNLTVEVWVDELEESSRCLKRIASMDKYSSLVCDAILWTLTVGKLFVSLQHGYLRLVYFTLILP